MPCWSVNTLSVEFEAKNFDILGKVVTAMGLKFTVQGDAMVVHSASGDVTIENGKATGPQRAVSLLVNPLRVNYAKECVKVAAVKHGWQVTQLNQGKMVVQKR